MRSFIVEDFRPVYDGRLRSGALSDKVERARAMLKDCRACPRRCGVDRLADRWGVCRTGSHALVSSVFPHMGEESCLVGRRGSGTIFFGYCNLHCVFCQNWTLSQRRDGNPCGPEQIAESMLQLQAWGCHNINLVTPEHVVPQVTEAIVQAVMCGLHLPVVYNTSAYDSVDSLRLLDGLIDIYMPDFKYWEPETARRLSKAGDYPERAREAVLEMQRQVGPLTFTSDGLAVRGLLMRHLVMPGLVHESRAIFEWLAREVSPDTFVNVMGQYHPDHRVGKRLPSGARRFADIDRRPTSREMAEAVAAARQAGLWRLEGAA